jgi:ubiquitin-conjugating enzyme E2 D
MNLRRLNNEFKEFKKHSISNISACPIDDNLFEWEAIIIGPENTPYEQGLFKLNIYIPKDYPIKPPNVIFKTRIFHPNINHNGNICLDILKNSWNSSLTISKILLSICSLLNDPNTQDPLVPDIASLYEKDYNNYIKTAKEWTSIYAS